MFPRIVDPKGGFHEHWDSKWEKIDNDSRSVVFQSRAILVATAAAEVLPGHHKELHQYAKHGFDWLNNKQWDSEGGGFWWLTDSTGTPSDKSLEEKHIYGMAFAIYALAEMARVFDDPEALNLAVRTFIWLDHHALDKQHRGYFESLNREGVPYKDDGHPEVSNKQSWIETSRGYKTFNTHLHLLEALSSLTQVWQEPTADQRLTELLYLTKIRFYVDPGCFHAHYTSDWNPIPSVDSYGHDVEAAFLILEAAGLCDDPDPLDTADKARRTVDHAIDLALDPKNGGLYYEGDAFKKISNDNKEWWVQAEALNAFATLHSLFGTQTDHYANALVKTWDFVVKHQIDHTNKGWHPTVTPDGRPLVRQKLDPWTEGYHQTRCLINLHRLLQPTQEDL